MTSTNETNKKIELVIPRSDFRLALALGVIIVQEEGDRYSKYFTHPDLEHHTRHMEEWESMYINIPFREKDQAKAISQNNDAGLRWNKPFHCWVIPNKSKDLFDQWKIEPLIPSVA